MVDDLLHRHTRKTFLPRPPKETKKFIKCDFNNVFGLTISNVLRNHNINVAFSTSNNMFAFLKSHNRQRTPLADKSGVYKLSCGSCDMFCIGQTGRSFKTRFKEHLPKNTVLLSQLPTMQAICPRNTWTSKRTADLCIFVRRDRT